MRTANLIEFNGKKQGVAQWAEELGITPNALYLRLKKMPPEVALTWKKPLPAILLGEKYCPKCDRMLPISEYGKNRATTTSLPAYCKKCSAKHQRDYRTKLKMECLTKYSNSTVKCAHCGYDDPRALVIDHINNDGYKERETIKTNWGTRTYLAYLSEDRDDLQVLCCNCNWIKHIENTERLK